MAARNGLPGDVILHDGDVLVVEPPAGHEAIHVFVRSAAAIDVETVETVGALTASVRPFGSSFLLEFEESGAVEELGWNGTTLRFSGAGFSATVQAGYNFRDPD